MQILLISGSASATSVNTRLLLAIGRFADRYGHSYHLAESLVSLPTFQVDFSPKPPQVSTLEAQIAAADLILISTPEYLHNIPAALKNALEWMLEPGVLYQKKCVVFVATPHPPRGERALQSLLWSLEALNAQVLVQMRIFDAVAKLEGGAIVDAELHLALEALFEMLH